jgi:hypothetical protein
MTPPSSFMVQVVDNLTEVTALRGVWQGLETRPDSDLEAYLSVLKSRDEVLRPHMIMLKRTEGGPQALLAGRIEKKRLGLGFGYAKLSLPPVPCLTVIQSGLVGDESENTVSEIVNAVMSSLRNKTADVAWFHQVDVESNLYKHLAKAAPIFCRDYFPAFNDHWVMRLPDTYAELLRQKSSHIRNNIKRNSKRLQNTLGNGITVKHFRNPNDLEFVLGEIETIARKTYHRGLQVGFVNDDETRQRMTQYANQGQLRVYILYAGEKPIAFWTGFLRRRTFFTWTTGYDSDHSEARPGLFLLQRLFEGLCNEKVADELDFGSGDADYKRDWGDQNRRQVSVFVFAPTLRGAFLNMLRTPLIASSNVARWSLNKTGLLQGVKKIWRSRLSRQAISESNDKQIVQSGKNIVVTGRGD